MTAVSKKQRCVRSRDVVFLLLLITAVASTAVQAAVWRVNAASSAPTPDGQSWGTAYPSIQSAVDAAASGDELWVAAGTYTGARTGVVYLKAGVTLYGGFAGTETAREQRDWKANPTIIDGQGSHRCVTAVDAASAVNGFTLQNGISSGQGGGMYGGQATNCVFLGNKVTTYNSTGGGMYGGTVVNCTFSENSAADGGGMYGGMATNCTFTGNTANSDGGGMYHGTAINCTFTGNAATTSGGGMQSGKATNCIIWGNAPDESDYFTTVSFSCLSVATPGTGNFVGNPLFVNPWGGDFRLRAGSPCVDGGTAAGAPATDMLGRARPQGAGVDMGAYEHHPEDDIDAVDTLILRVNAASTAANPDGLTWQTAYPTIQAAVDRCGYGGEFWVAAGTYTAGAGNEVVRLLLQETSIYGGFAGMETVRNQRDWRANPTIIDGQGARRCVTAVASNAVNGFTLRNGKATRGGGMSYGTAVNCTFTNSDGGGMYSGTAINCTFTANRGGGMNGGTATNCTFTGNAAGGGMSSGTATNCVFWGNAPHETDTTEVSFSCLADVTTGMGNIVCNPLFVNPWAGDFRLRADSPCVDSGTAAGAPSTDLLGRIRPQGAGIDMGAYEYCPGDDAHVVFAPPVLRVNAASTAAFPDGLTWQTAFSTLQAAADQSGYGGEIWVAAGTYTAAAGNEVVRLLRGTSVFGGFAGTETVRDQRGWTANPTIIDGQGVRRCVTAVDSTCAVNSFTLRNGFAFEGGGMYFGAATNCVFSGNTNSGMSYGTATNCVISGNNSGMSYGTANNCVIWANTWYDTYETAVSYSCLSETTTGTGNIIGNPGFVNPWAGDFRLRADSPCIDAGTAAGAPATDMLGRARPQGAGVDMGAYEYHPGDDIYAVDTLILRVNAASTAAQPDGLTWKTAYRTLQAAADKSGYGSEIWVAAGTYTGTGGQVVSLKANVTLYGGFAGTETARDQRDSKANPTIFDGQGVRTCVMATNMSAVNGFTVQNGKAYEGAGMYNGTATNCTFTGNSAEYGGAMRGGTATNCTFVGNSASERGGGMLNGTAINCTFIGNVSDGGGGALDYGTATSCIFNDNSAFQEGGGMRDGSAVNCTFTGNYAFTGGGKSYGTATNCIFTGNSAIYGGGMYYGTATNCTFFGNQVGEDQY